VLVSQCVLLIVKHRFFVICGVILQYLKVFFCLIFSDVWSKSVSLKGGNSHLYRYFICKIVQSESEDDTGRGVNVKWWEGHIKPRRFSPTGKKKSMLFGGHTFLYTLLFSLTILTIHLIGTMRLLFCSSV